MEYSKYMDKYDITEKNQCEFCRENFGLAHALKNQ